MSRRYEVGKYGRLYVRLWPWPLFSVGKYHDLGILCDMRAVKRSDGSYVASVACIVCVIDRWRLPLIRKLGEADANG